MARQPVHVIESRISKTDRFAVVSAHTSVHGYVGKRGRWVAFRNHLHALDRNVVQLTRKHQLQSLQEMNVMIVAECSPYVNFAYTAEARRQAF